MKADINTDTEYSTGANPVLSTAWQAYCLLNKLLDRAVCIDIVRKLLEILLVTICPLSCLCQFRVPVLQKFVSHPLSLN